MARILGYAFVDAELFIACNSRGLFDMKKTNLLSQKIGLVKTALKCGVVIPGFYGKMPNENLKTFSRGGSDITGAIVASITHADLYENWKDVSGIYEADPRVVKNPEKIQKLTYQQLHRLSWHGQAVFHREAIIPLMKAGIPTQIKNTNQPEDQGSFIVPGKGNYKINSMYG
jgi:aspartate kinase